MVRWFYRSGLRAISAPALGPDLCSDRHDETDFSPKSSTLAAIRGISVVLAKKFLCPSVSLSDFLCPFLLADPSSRSRIYGTRLNSPLNPVRLGAFDHSIVSARPQSVPIPHSLISPEEFWLCTSSITWLASLLCLQILITTPRLFSLPPPSLSFLT